jgi:hypothetical protein
MRALMEQFGISGFVVLGMSIAAVVVLIVVIARGVPRRRKPRS